jgi:hypothetical protein
MNPMNLDRAVLAFTGFVVLASLVLGYTVTPYAYLLTVFVGASLLQAAWTGVCFSSTIFKMIGCPPGQAFR